MNSIKVSVIIPVYNSDLYLEECIKSVINQKLKEIEIICIDDGSDDDSLAILKKYKEIDSRISIIQKKHSNAGDARNRGLMIAQGDYLSFLDSDDFFDPYLLEKAYKKAIANDSDIVVYGAKTYNSITKKYKLFNGSLNTESLPAKDILNKESISDHLFDALGVNVWNKMIKRNLILDNNIMFQSVTRSNDIFFALTLLACSKSISILREPLVYYRIEHENHIQAHNEDDPIVFLFVLIETQKKLKEILKNDYFKYEQSFLNVALRTIIYNINTLSKYRKEYYYINNVVAYNGEKFFHFLNYDESYYYNKNDYISYKDIVNDFDNLSIVYEEYNTIKKAKLKNIAYGMSSLILLIERGIQYYKENGIYDTFKKISKHHNENKKKQK